MKEFFKKIWGWIRKDGLLHIGVSAVLVILFSLMLLSLGYTDPGTLYGVSAVLTFLAGLGKEVYDSIKKKEFIEWHDLICDLIGIVIGEIIIILIFLA